MSKKPSPSLKPAAAESPKVRTLTLTDLDVLPPVRRAGKPGEPMPMAEIEDHVRAIDGRITESTREYQNNVIYDIVGKGLMLLKGEAHYLVKHLPETVSGKSHKRNKKGQLAAQEGFAAWLEKLGMNERTARNYRNAARNCGLTSDHSLDDVEALRQAAALHEKKPTDLYRLTEPDAPPPPDDNQPAANLVADTFATTRTSLEQLRACKEEMEPDVYESVCAMLKEELEAFTGRAWDMSDREPGVDAAGHGEATAKSTKGSKKGGRK